MSRAPSTPEAEPSKTILPGSPVLTGLVTDTGLKWDEFIRTLQPRYGRAWLDLAICYAMIVLGLSMHAWVVHRAGNGIGLLLAPLAAVWLGYWVAPLVCFLHEAAHYNLHPSKRTNDRLANLFLAPLRGVDVSTYRATHWQHHLHLGTPEDTEVSYHNAPTLRFVLEALTGVQILHLLRSPKRRMPTRSASQRKENFTGILLAVAFHAAIVIPLVVAGFVTTALAWIIASVSTYPFFNAIRQLLEHRSVEADPRADYTLRHHGAVNRLFGSDLFSRTFGAAGFNRHLLHHWYPSASYTCFDELEAFLGHTELAATMNMARTTYFAALRELTRRCSQSQSQ